MRTTRFRRTLAVLTAAAVLASLTAATVASPAAAAKPRCQGKVATIVGTARGEVIRGTAGRDIIVAKGGPDRIYGKGGNDLICAGGGNDIVYAGPGADVVWGQVGNDRLVGNAGPDFLAGQIGNDTLNGGIGVDTCYQGTGTGPVTNCELPAPPPPPPPPPPTLVVAYTDANKNHLYDAGDVMIAEILDTNGDGIVSPGDTINMGQYPTTPYAVAPAEIRQTMEDWKVKTHTLTTGDADPSAHTVIVQSGASAFGWWRNTGNPYDRYAEQQAANTTWITDASAVGGTDFVDLKASPSQPTSVPFYLEAPGQGDDHFVDVEIFVP